MFEENKKKINHLKIEQIWMLYTFSQTSISFSMFDTVCFLFITALTFFCSVSHLFLAALAEKSVRFRRLMGDDVTNGPENAALHIVKHT